MMKEIKSAAYQFYRYFSEIVYDVFQLIYLIIFGIYSVISIPISWIIPQQEKNLQAETIVIFGHASELLKHVCKELKLRNVSKLIICTDQPDHDFKAFVFVETESCKTFGLKFEFVDFSNADSFRKLAERIVNQFGPATVILNLLSYQKTPQPEISLLQQSFENIEQSVSQNLTSNFWIAREFLPTMISNKKGHFVWICSTVNFWGFDDDVVGAGKSCGGLGFVESLRDEVFHHMSMGDPNIKFTLVVTPTSNHTRTRCSFETLFWNMDDLSFARTVVDAFCKNKDVAYFPPAFGYLLWMENVVPQRFINMIRLWMFSQNSQRSRSRLV